MMNRDLHPLFARYLAGVSQVESQELSGEESHYASLREMLEGFARGRGWEEVRALVRPRRVQGLCPDLQVAAGGDRVVGYVEAKAPGTRLAAVVDSPQVRRYRESFPNLLVTNFHEFLLLRGDEEADRARLAQCLPSGLTGIAPPVEGGGEVARLLERFLSFGASPSRSAESLARSLALRTRLLKEMIAELLAAQLAADPSSDGPVSGIGAATAGGEVDRRELAGFYRAFAEHLMAGLTADEFADLYAQTLTFGLFAARLRSRGPFELRTAFDAIPESNGILRDVFRYIQISDPPREIRWIVRDLVAVLRDTDLPSLLDRDRRRHGRRDPILYFYETFLAAYDAEERRRRGVFYTPPALVTYLVRSADEVLRHHLGRRDGLADPSVTVLDPAAGTATFLVEAFRRARDTYVATYGDARLEAFVREHLLRRFWGFELMMAPYAVGHLNLGALLEEMGYPPAEHERPGLLLTDALDFEELEQTELPGMASLSRESREAGRIKREVPVTVVMGNPPYQGHSANRHASALVRQGYERADGTWDDGYYRCQGRPLGERNPRWLQDDYVKFLRFAQRKVDAAGSGVVAFVTNHGYLDNPTFRGLRESLLASFDELYLLDLHGNSKKGETAPDGSKDENVFPIRQGVAAAILVRRPRSQPAPGERAQPGRVFRADLHGTRRRKLRWLEAHERASTIWTEVEPRPPLFLFTAEDAELRERYELLVPLNEIFPTHAVGVVTGRDAFVVDTCRRTLLERLGAFRKGREASWAVEEHLGLQSTRTWDREEARRRLAADEHWTERIRPILFRPFDVRWVLYSDDLLERPRRALMHHMLAGPNLGLVLPKQGREGGGALVTEHLVAHKAVSAYDINYLFPLYLYPRSPLFEETGGERIPNLGKSLAQRLRQAYGACEPEALLAYVYAVLSSSAYRQRYAPLLARELPRLPFPRDPELFARVVEMGRRLVDLHLLRAPDLHPPLARLRHEPEECRAESLEGPFPAYRETETRIYLSRDRFVDGVEPRVWQLKIGGWQVLKSWLEARKHRPLSHEESRTLPRLVTALERAISLEAPIAALVEEVEGCTL